MSLELTKRQKISVMVGVMMAMLLSALDQTIVSTAIPRIAQELNGLQHLSWLFTSYMLASTIAVPIYGKLADMYGRKRFFIIGIIIFLIGSALCGVSQSMNQLILFRALQGIGGGAIMVNAIASIGDIFPPAERGKWQGLIGGVFGLASIAGPLLGGWLTDAGNWRWVFYVNLPLGILAIALISVVLPKIVPDKSIKRSIDYAGAITLAFGLIALLLACVWGGSEYAWSSIQIIGLFAVALVFLGLFIFIENKVQEPIIPLELFHKKVFTVSMGVIFLTAISMFGAIVYIPLFAQSVIGTSATHSGLILTPLMIGLIFSSAISGQLISRTGKYKVLATFGIIISGFGTYLLSRMSVDTTNTQLVLNMIVLGLGLGVSMPIFNVVVQSAFDHSKLGVVTASTQMFRNIGGTVGTAILGTVMNNRLTSHLDELQGNAFVQKMGTLDANSMQHILSPQGKEKVAQMIAQAPVAVQAQLQTSFTDFSHALQVGLADSITHTYVWGVGFSIVAFLLVLFLPEISLRRSNKPIAESIGTELEIELAQSDAEHEPK